jgi:hypothetical protein
MKALQRAELASNLDLLKMLLLERPLDLALREDKIQEKKQPPSQQFSSSTMYRETSVSAAVHSTATVKREVTRRREKFSFKKSIVGTGSFKSCQWPIGDPLEEGFSLLWWSKYSH